MAKIEFFNYYYKESGEGGFEDDYGDDEPYDEYERECLRRREQRNMTDED